MSSITEPRAVRSVLITITLLFLGLLVAAPLAVIFGEALSQGFALYLAALTDPDALAAIQLTLLVVLIAVPVNTAFGLCAGWAIAKFEFRGKRALMTATDLPFAVSPVISGMIFVLLFGQSGLFGAWLAAHDLSIIFAAPGIVLATLFVTSPFVAREIIPVLQAAGTDEEEAARVLGAGGFQIFRRVTLPQVRWALAYGAILCTARAMGEFGAVSVVSGHIRGQTNTLPLHVEILYNEYNFQAAFAAASVLSVIAIGTLALKGAVEWRMRRDAAELAACTQDTRA